MPKRELPMKGDEYDALTRWRRFLNWRPGVRASIKRGYNKRVRREAKRTMANAVFEVCLQSRACSRTHPPLS